MRHCFVFVVPDEALNDGHLPAPKEEDEVTMRTMTIMILATRM
jgi:hypothetical protein